MVLSDYLEAHGGKGANLDVWFLFTINRLKWVGRRVCLCL
jgi:hypothetical protein